MPIRDAEGDVPPWLRELCLPASIKKLAMIRGRNWIAQHGESTSAAAGAHQSQLISPLSVFAVPWLSYPSALSPRLFVIAMQSYFLVSRGPHHQGAASAS